MTFEIVLVLAILLGAVACFATERLPVDLVALSVLSVLLASGILTPEQAISGFSNTATVTVAAMFVLSGSGASSLVFAIPQARAEASRRFRRRATRSGPRSWPR